MAEKTTGRVNESDIRLQANSRISGAVVTPEDSIAKVSTVLRVLHDLASSPDSAPNALAVLHELQVHQIELKLQEENLRSALGELETALDRQSQLYEFAPFGYFTLEPDMSICEVNRIGATVLGVKRECLIGTALDNYLAPAAASALREVFSRIRSGSPHERAAVQFMTGDARQRTFHAAINADPTGEGFLVAILDIEEPT